MATNQQGQRSQNDPNAAQNQNPQGQSQSNQSSPEAQRSGSIDQDQERSVRSGLSGQASRPHRVGDGHHADDLEDQVNTTMTSGTGMNPPSDKGSERQSGKSGMGRTGGSSGMGTEGDRNANTGNTRNG
ncbi:hypothetical protein [Hymenobacter sp. B81]|uniref:hypothetical protein n=1 Tax=Hymenobacter sp. B81 TaxID=3344878 RepID=UPI0037DDC9D6